MRKYALEITEIIKGVPHIKFIENKTIRYAIERLLLIISEAANHVSNPIQYQLRTPKQRDRFSAGLIGHLGIPYLGCPSAKTKLRALVSEFFVPVILPKARPDTRSCLVC